MLCNSSHVEQLRQNFVASLILKIGNLGTKEDICILILFS